jgi:hypothetical protein
MGIDMDSRLLSSPARFRELRRKRETVGVGGIVISVSDVLAELDSGDDGMEGSEEIEQGIEILEYSAIIT